MPIPPQVRSTSSILLIGLSLDAFMLGSISLLFPSGSLPGRVRLVTLGAIGFSSCALMFVGYSVAGGAIGIEATVALKMTARARDIEVLALVLIPVIGMALPALSDHLPGAAGVMAFGAVAIAQFFVA